MKPIITRFDKNSGDILLSIPMFDKDIFHRIQQIEKDNPSWFDLEHYNIFDLIKENQELKKHLEVPETCNLKTLEDYKSYYEDTTREQILEDTYIEYCAYVNLAHRYSELKKQLEESNNISS